MPLNAAIETLIPDMRLALMENSIMLRLID